VDKPLDLLQGRLDRLIRTAVSFEPLHAYGMLLRIQQISKNRLEIQQGPLYPALYRLDHHRLTPAGKRRLQTEVEKWNPIAGVIAGIPGTTPEEV